MALPDYMLFAFSSLFAIVDPIAAVPTFLAMTSDDPPAERIRMARLACIVAAAVLIGFAIAGTWVFRLLGITLPAFQVAGSIVLLLVSLDMLRARRSEVKETLAEADAGAAKDDVAITPLAVPMLAGPGACTTAIMLQHRAAGYGQYIALYVCIAAIFLTSYLILHMAARGAHRISPIAMRIVTRLMGLLLAAVAVQFMFDGIKASGVLGWTSK